MSDNWLETIREMAFMVCKDNGVHRLMYMTLIDAVYCMKYGKAEEQLEANTWFHDPDHGGLSLRMVCDTLDLDIGNIQYRARRMYARHLEEQENDTVQD